jgi:Short C-terminal domain
MGLMRPRRVGVVGMAARTAVVAGTATAVSGRVQRRQQEKYASQDQAAYDQQMAAQQQQYAAPPQEAAPAAAGDDVVAQIEQLSQLHNSGVLNDEQFEAAKAKLLG